MAALHPGLWAALLSADERQARFVSKQKSAEYIGSVTAHGWVKFPEGLSTVVDDGGGDALRCCLCAANCALANKGTLHPHDARALRSHVVTEMRGMAFRALGRRMVG